MSKFIFKESDIIGGGQYLVRTDSKPGDFIATPLLSTIMVKVGYMHSNEPNNLTYIRTLVSMSDGCISYGVHEEADGKFYRWNSEKELVDYLNDNSYCESYRFATQQEVMRVVEYQQARWRNN